MRLRTAIKIMRALHGTDYRNDRSLWWRKETIWKARTICRKKWRDGRVPLIPTDEELMDGWEVIMGIFQMLGDQLQESIDDAVQNPFSWSTTNEQ